MFDSGDIYVASNKYTTVQAPYLLRFWMTMSVRKPFNLAQCLFFFFLVNTIGLFINSYQHEDKFEQVYILSIFLKLLIF